MRGFFVNTLKLQVWVDSTQTWDTTTLQNQGTKETSGCLKRLISAGLLAIPLYFAGLLPKEMDPG